jgi:carboxyl-terminal processing protease
MTLKGRKDYFQGKLIVLIDHESGSASEIFARLMQLEKRGVVLGDVSAGAVMQSLGHPLTMVTGISTEVGYGVSVTNADVIMSDGKSVEHMGVTPDELVLPTAEDIREGRDPVLARAMEILGQKMTPQEAYKIFEKAYKWNDN